MAVFKSVRAQIEMFLDTRKEEDAMTTVFAVSLDECGVPALSHVDLSSDNVGRYLVPTGVVCEGWSLREVAGELVHFVEFVDSVVCRVFGHPALILVVWNGVWECWNMYNGVVSVERLGDAHTIAVATNADEIYDCVEQKYVSVDELDHRVEVALVGDL